MRRRVQNNRDKNRNLNRQCKEKTTPKPQRVHTHILCDLQREEIKESMKQEKSSQRKNKQRTMEN